MSRKSSLLWIIILSIFANVGINLLSQSQTGTPAQLRVKTDSAGYLLASGAVQTPPYFTSTFNTTRLRTDSNGNLLVASSGGMAPSNATYITQTPNSSLSAEQALSTLSSGIMRVATTTGVVTSLTDSAGIFTNISDETGGTGVLVGNVSPSFTTTTTLNRNAIATTSTDGHLVLNSTAATSGVTQQYSPRIKYCGTGWNSSGGGSSEIDCWGTEVRPQAVAGTTTSQYYWTSSINNGAFSDVMSLTNAGNLTISTLTSGQVNMSSGFRSSANGTTITMPADGRVNFRNNATTGFTSLEVASDIIYSWAIPTITSGFSTSAPSIAGKVSAFAVTVAATPGVTGTVAFNMTWSNIPSVSCTNTITANIVQAVPTTTTVVLNGVWVQGDIIRCIVIGY